MAVSLNLHWVLVVGVLVIRALPFGVYSRAPDMLETPKLDFRLVISRLGDGCCGSFQGKSEAVWVGSRYCLQPVMVRPAALKESFDAEALASSKSEHLSVRFLEGGSSLQV